MFNSRSEGFVLLTSLAAVIVLTLAGASLLVNGISQTNIGLRTYHRSSALHLAEAGVQQAALNLRTASTTDDSPAMDGVATAALSSGGYTIGSPQTVGVGITKIIVTGTSQLEQRRVEATYRLTPESVFQFALFADQQVLVSGSAITDSYDSRNGAYNNDQSSPSYNAGHNGDVGTNGTTSGGVTVGGGSLFIDGQVAVGVGVSDSYSVVSASGCGSQTIQACLDPVITGGYPAGSSQDVVTQPTDFPLPPVNIPPALTAVCGPMTVGGNQTKTLPVDGSAQCIGDECCFTQLQVQGGGTLTASGPVTVYLTGEFTATGNTVVGVPSEPTWMLIQVAATGEATLEGTITGSSQFYGAIYAPDATITVSGDAEVYGAIIANTVNVTGSAEIHYDEAMTDVTDISNTFQTEVIAWREL